MKKSKIEVRSAYIPFPSPNPISGGIYWVCLVTIFFLVCRISVTFFDKDGEQEIKVPIGMSMLEAAHENDIELEGACEGSLACSTCHVIVMDLEQYNKLEDPTDEENDMLDLAFGLTETSRLGCQVIAKPELDGLRLALPAATRNFAVDGYKPKPH
ncbi:hypothetical protein OSB04_004478 [Centaurea solstitialis]|uniref:2Fe-2S ferredoxin-type domain-containing protein n=1 Tax=Centaurea solstitialis TaxID=347529 RepID=A0AA38UDI2_9ASTR|nr:hypothetical protein OSB04_004478 [Centaurea solstitialis]